MLAKLLKDKACSIARTTKAGRDLNRITHAIDGYDFEHMAAEFKRSDNLPKRCVHKVVVAQKFRSGRVIKTAQCDEYRAYNWFGMASNQALCVAFVLFLTKFSRTKMFCR